MGLKKLREKVKQHQEKVGGKVHFHDDGKLSNSTYFALDLKEIGIDLVR